MKTPERVVKPEEVYSLVKRYAKARQEQFIVITLDSGHKPISLSIVFIGTVSRIIIHSREVFYRAIRDMAVAIIVCHNHPSGELKPSPEDLEMTRNLWQAGNILGIRLLDHLIISKTDYFSFRQNDCLPDDKKS
jgi:DNA repair protein RadC